MRRTRKHPIMAEAHRIEEYPHWKLAEWPAEFPEGRIERIYTHWSAHDYRAVFPAYHFCVATDDDGEIVVVNTHDPRGRNSFALGISIMSMEGSKPSDFGEYPLTEPLIDALCYVGAKIARFYNIPIDADHVMSHAEAAKIENYFGTADNERWDIARLSADPRPLVPEDAVTVGDELRRRMREHLG
jgi:hypothetical protein